MTTKEIAYKLFNQGIASIPIADSKSKRPPKGLKWGDLSDENYDAAKIEEIYSQPHEALAVMGGFISTGLEILDVDLKNARDPEQLWTDLLTNIEAALPEFREKCTIAKTPSGGYHIYYSCWEIEGNKKLAYEDHHGKRLCVIETRGDGGYALTWPSDGYEFIQGGIDSFAYALGTDERDTLHEICRIFNEEVEDVAYQETKRFVPKGRSFIRNPFDDYRDRVPFHEVEALIREAGFEKPKQNGPRVFFHRIGSDNEQGANYHLEKKCLYVWTSNSLLSPDRGYNPTTLLCELRHRGDWKECYKWLIQNGYGERIQAEDEPYIQEVQKRLDEGEDKEVIKEDLAKKNLSPDRTDKYVEIAENRMVRMETFWEEENGKVSVDIVRLKHFLENHGFRKYRMSADDPNSRLVHIDQDNHRIREVEIEYVKEFLEAYLLDESLALPAKTQEDVLRSLMNMTTRFFKDSMFEWLEAVTEGQDVKILKDTAVSSYFFFKDHLVKITASKPEILPYHKLDKDVMIWDEEVIKRNVSLVNMREFSNIRKSEYFMFLKRLVMLDQDTDKMDLSEMVEKYPEQVEKLNSFITTIGYLCHRFNDPKRGWAVIVAEDILNSSEGGGTGKGIFMKSLAKARKAVFESGKVFDPKSQFAMQKWKPGTNLYLVDDVTRKFDFESLYSFISDGGTIERKYQTAFELPFSRLPKFVFSTNYGDMADGNVHGERRRKMLLVGKHYGPHFTPFQEFGHNLFIDWDDEQWNLFYNVIFTCIRDYLSYDVVDFPASDNVKIKTFLQHYGGELFEFFEQLSAREWLLPVMLDDIVNEFHEVYKRKKFSSQLFLIALEKYCDMCGHEIEKSKGTNRSNLNKRLIRILRIRTSNSTSLYIDTENEDENEELPF